MEKYLRTPVNEFSRRHLLLVSTLFVSKGIDSLFKSCERRKMLGNCEDKIISSSTTNQWLQIILDDHTPSMASPSSNNNNNKSMAAAAAAADPSSTTPLKCPRCDSSNTKFCYYNNYSLSQPRHFCKACKRYWTRGGTLRNVPVGGGCRKNKRHKRHSSSSASASADVSSQPQIDLPPPSQSPNLFYGNPLELSFPFSSFRVSSDDGGFDLHHPQINALGLGFSSESYKNGFKPIQDGNASSSPFSAAASNNNNSIFFGSSSFSSASTMASLLSSTQKFGAAAAFKDFQSHNNLMPYDDNPQMPGTGKQAVKVEGENRFSWNPSSNPNPSPNPNPMDQINSSDPSSLVWNTSSISAWFDPSTMGSSVPSLI